MRILYSLLLVGVTVVWGWTFVVVQDAIALYGVLGFLVVRFVLAAAALAPCGACRISLQTLMVGVGIGIALALGYLFQTTGLLFTSPTNSGLITGLFVVFVPLADLLTLLCAAALGLHIALLSRYAARYDTTGLAFAQMLSVALIFAVFWPFFEPVTFPPREVWFALGMTGLVAWAGAFWVQPSSSSASQRPGRRLS